MASEKEGKKEDLVLSHGLRGKVIRKATVQMLPEDRQLVGQQQAAGSDDHGQDNFYRQCLWKCCKCVGNGSLTRG